MGYYEIWDNITSCNQNPRKREENKAVEIFEEI